MEAHFIPSTDTFNFKKKNTRNRILKIASELFLEKGFSSTSIEDILERVDIAKGTFYHHFISKESLLESVAGNLSQTSFTEILNRLEDSNTNNSLGKLNALFRITMEWKDENIETLIQLIKSLCSESNISLKYTLLLKNRQLSIPLVTDILLNGKKENYFKIDNPQISAEIILILLEGLSEHLKKDLLEQSDLPIGEVVNHYQTSIERNLGLDANSIHIIDWKSYQSIKEKMNRFKYIAILQKP